MVPRLHRLFLCVQVTTLPWKFWHFYRVFHAWNLFESILYTSSLTTLHWAFTFPHMHARNLPRGTARRWLQTFLRSFESGSWRGDGFVWVWVSLRRDCHLAASWSSYILAIVAVEPPMHTVCNGIQRIYSAGWHPFSLRFIRSFWVAVQGFHYHHFWIFFLPKSSEVISSWRFLWTCAWFEFFLFYNHWSEELSTAQDCILFVDPSVPGKQSVANRIENTQPVIHLRLCSYIILSLW